VLFSILYSYALFYPKRADVSTGVSTYFLIV